MCVMIDFTKMSYDELLHAGGHACQCGGVHTTELKYLRIGSGAVRLVTDALDALGFKKPFVLCDPNTYGAAGKTVVGILEDADIPYTLFVFPIEAGEHLEPDEWAVGSAAMGFDPTCDVVLAVGSGVINDTGKVLAHIAGIPSMVVGTAPSMDGYASGSSSMIQNGLKVSLYNACPVAIIADLDIMKNAPARMLMAGLGDVLAKCIALCDWRIAHLVVDEPYCEPLAQLMRYCVQTCLDNAEGLMRREPEAVRGVIEGLVLSGVAMSFAGSSRPASGLEHYFSHMWEMMTLQRGGQNELHGIQVCVGTCLCLRLFAHMREVVPDTGHATSRRAAFSQKEWEDTMTRIFGSVAPVIIRGEREIWHKNDEEGHARRLKRIVDSWDEIVRAIDEELPDAQDTISRLHALAFPTTPADIGFDHADTVDAFIGSREIRDKYLVSSMLWDLGLLETFTRYLD